MSNRREKLDRKSFTGIILVLFVSASWAIGNLMYLMSGSGGGTGHLAQIELQIPKIWMLAFIVAGFALIGLNFLRSESYAYFAIVFTLPAIMLGVYFMIRFPSIYFVLIFVALIGVFIGIRRGYEGKEMMYMVIIGVVLLLITYFGTGGELVGPEGGDGEAPSIGGWDDPNTMIKGVFGNYGTFMLVIFFIALIVFLLYQRFSSLLGSSPEEKEEDVEEDLSYTVNRAISELHKGKDVESTILRYYQRMCMILEEKGVENEESMTPREFEWLATRKLSASSSKISSIREIFELAKYSNHQLGESDRDRALNDLQSLREELR